MKTKRLWSLLLVLALALGLFAVPAGADGGDVPDFVLDGIDWPYELEYIETEDGTYVCHLWMGGPNSGTVSIVDFDVKGCDYDQEIDHLVVPDALTIGEKSYPVRTVRIDDSYSTQIRRLTIPDSVARLGAPDGGSYYQDLWIDFTELEVLDLGAGLIEMGHFADYNYRKDIPFTINLSPKNPHLTMVDGVIYSKDMTEIQYVPYSAIKDGTFHIPDSVTKIGDYAFEYLGNLTSVTIPAQVTEIGEGAFGNIGYTLIPTEDTFGELDIKTVTVTFAPGSKLTKLVGSPFLNDHVVDLTIPDGITELPDGCFYNLTAQTVSLPDGITVLPERCFSGATLGSIKLPAKLQVIEDYGFCEARFGTEPILPNTLWKIGTHAFGGTTINSLVLPDSVIRLGDGAFDSSTIRNITLSKGLKVIPEGCFAFCHRLNMPKIPDGVVKIEDSAFNFGNKLAGEGDMGLDYGVKRGVLEIPDSVKYIGDHAFAFEPHTGLVLPERLAYLSTGYPFIFTNAGDLVYPDCVTRMPCNAVFNVTMNSITIPPSVLSIEDDLVNDDDGTGIAIAKSVTIKGYEGTAAEEYAKSHGNPFVSLGPKPPTYPITTQKTDNTETSYRVRICGTEMEEACEGGTVPFWVSTDSACVQTVKVTTASGKDVPYTMYDNSYGSLNCYFVMPAEAVTISAVYEDRPTQASSTGVNPQKAGGAYASTQPVEVDGVKRELQAYALADPVTGNKNNYVKVRDVAALLDGTAAQFDVQWSGGVNLVPGVPYDSRNGQENHTPYSGNRAYTKATAPTMVNYNDVEIQAFVLTDDQGNGSTYYKLRDLGQVLGFNVGWTLKRGIYIETGKPYDISD